LKEKNKLGRNGFSDFKTYYIVNQDCNGVGGRAGTQVN
jgi:hypothetical protein